MPNLSLEATLTQSRDSGKKLLVPYVTGGLGDWVEIVHAVIDAGADAVEVGIPFSDPIRTGLVVCAFNTLATSVEEEESEARSPVTPIRPTP